MKPLQLKLLFIILFSLFYSTLVFSQITKKNANDTIGRVGGSYNILKNNFSQIDSISLQSIQELRNQLEQLDFISGTIYFSGANFGNVVATNVKGKKFTPQYHFDRCISGTRISFYKCQIRNSDGTKSILNKTIVFK